MQPEISRSQQSQAIPRLLLVEDHVLVRQSIRSFLQGMAIEVVGEASTGLEAVQLATDLHPDIIIMDIHLPGISGIEATRRIHRQNPDVRIIALTAYNEQAYQRALRDAGADGFVLKTSEMSELMQEIERVLGTHNQPHAEANLPAEPELRLTERELEVLICAARGWTNKQIGGHLVISDRTVQVHLQTIYHKLGAASRTEAVSRAIALGIISPVDSPGH